MGTSNATATANWSAISMTVNYNVNGGNTVNPTSKSVTYDENYGDLPTPTRSNYAFAGWYTASSGGTKVTSTTKVTQTANHSIYAHWNEVVPITTKILADNNERAESGISFNTVSSSSGTTGLYYTSGSSITQGGSTVYYYRGAVTNNYLVFAGFCWRIVRTNENGSVKIRYGGVPNAQGECPQTGTPVNIGSTRASTYYGGSAVGYMQNRTCTSISTCQTNTTNSLTKDIIDTWYANNIANQGSSVTGLIANTIYCNDRAVYSGSGTGSNTTWFAAPARFVSTSTTNELSSPRPIFKCNQTNDQFTLSVANGGTSGYGNNKLDYPIGLLTADEVTFAGGATSTSQTNSTFYLYTSEDYWLMTAFRLNYADGSLYNLYANGNLWLKLTDQTSAVVPVISLASTATISDGTGSYNSPYIVP